MRMHRGQACMLSPQAPVDHWPLTALHPCSRCSCVTFRPICVGSFEPAKRAGSDGVTSDAKRPRMDVHAGGLGLRVPSDFIDDVRMLP